MTSRAVALVSYNSPVDVPAMLRVVGFVASPTPAVLRVTGTFYSGITAAPVNMAVWGAVNYATGDLVPPAVVPIAKE